MKPLLFLTFVGCVVLANQFVAWFGLVPVGFGLVAPAGTLLAGVALIVRDELQDRAGKRAATVAILLGALISSWTAGPALALASGLAFVVSELADMATFTALHRRPVLGRLASNGVGSVVDTVLFLAIAGFGVTAPAVAGQLLVKLGYAQVFTFAFYRWAGPARRPATAVTP